MKENREEYQNEKEKREKRLLAYADMIQSAVQQDSSEVIRQLVEERKRQRLTQQELSDITGVRTSNIARFDIVDAGKVCECIGKTHRSKYT